MSLRMFSWIWIGRAAFIGGRKAMEGLKVMGNGNLL